MKKKLKSIKELLLELEERKEKLDTELTDISKQKEIIEKIFPKDLHWKNKHKLEDKVDLLVRFYELILKYNDHYTRITKDQITLMMRDSELNKGTNKSGAIAARLFDKMTENNVDLSELAEEFDQEIKELEEKSMKGIDISRAMPIDIKEADDMIKQALSGYDHERDFDDTFDVPLEDEVDPADLIALTEEEEKKKLNEEILKDAVSIKVNNKVDLIKRALLS